MPDNTAQERETRKRVTSDGSPAPLTPRGGWSDGVHYVRPATRGDRHPLRWVMAAHNGRGGVMKSRHIASLQEGIDLCEAVTKKLGKAVASAKSEPVMVCAVPARPPAFSFYYFNCIQANPVAQVWQCVSLPERRKPAGRRSKSGRPAVAQSFRHVPEQCVVVINREPVRDPDGQVTVFERVEASERAQRAYDDEVENPDRLYWAPGHTRVGATAKIDVLFDPERHGEYKPFVLWLAYLDRAHYVYEDRTVMAKDVDHAMYDVNPEAYMRQRKLDRVPSFEERPLRFRSLEGAEAEADRRQRMLEGKPA